MKDPLAGTRPTFFPNPADPPDPDRRDEDLRTIFAETRAEGSGRSRRLLPVTVAATVLVAAVVVVTAQPGEPPSAMSDEAARRVLLAAADAVTTSDAPVSGRYWHVRTRHGGAEGMLDYRMSWETSSEYWYSSTGDDKSVQLLGVYTNRPFAPKDRPGWEKAGYPVEPPLPPHATVFVGDPVIFLDGFTMTLSEVLALPTDQEALKSWLLDRYRENSPEEPWMGDQTDWLARQAIHLLANCPVTSGTRSAAYQLLAGLPGFRAMDASELPNGSVVGVARETRSSMGEFTVANGVLDQQVIIDPDTGTLVTERYVLVEPGSETAPLPPGTVINYSTVEHAGWVDTEPVLPPDAIIKNVSYS